MEHKHGFESIDRTMQDIRKKSSPFWGLTVPLPVVRHGSRPDIVDATLKSSYLWQFVTRLQLTQNMRAKLRGESSRFADFLLSIEGGKEEHHKDKEHFFIKLPDDMTEEIEKELMDFVFGGIENITQTQLGYHHAQSFALPTVK